MLDAHQLRKKCCEASGSDMTLLVVTVSDWDSDLAPWPAENVFAGRCFAGKGRELLKELEKQIGECLERQCPGHGKLYIAGYSLAGLFALWALYESTCFDGAASGSGSLWYPGWEQYAMERSFDREVCVYLSLGKAEPKTKHPLMKQVGRITQQQYELLERDPKVRRTTFEWNEGGHFADPADRMSHAVAWLVKKDL